MSFSRPVLLLLAALTAGAALHGPAVAAALGAPAAGRDGERLWLLGGLALSLTAAGVVAWVAARGRGGDD